MKTDNHFDASQKSAHVSVGSVLLDSKTVCATRRQVLLKRVRYLASLIFWTLRHRSLSRGRWVTSFEGKKWN